MADPVYVLVQMDVTDPDRFGPEYAGPLLQQFMEIGVEPLVATTEPEVVEGSYSRSNTVILRFASRAAFDDWYGSDAYAPLKAKRAELSDATNTRMLILPAFALPG